MTVIWGFLGLSFLVFFHELGHFAVARLCGIKVEAFSIGMGPVLLHKTIGSTDYRISLIPLGGYCAMKGEKDYQEAIELGLDRIEGDKDSFYGVHPFKRLITAFAGPLFNMIFAVFAFTLIALVGYPYYSLSTKVSMADEDPEYSTVYSPAHEAGLETGDMIRSINGTPMNEFSDIITFVSLHGNEELKIEVDRNGEILEFTVHSDLDKSTGAGRIGVIASADSYTVRHYGPFSFFPAVRQGILKSAEMTALSLKSLGILFKGVDVTKVISGPARIIKMIGDTAVEGFSESFNIGLVNFLNLLSLISISLFLTNLLPIPVLDGGLILFAAAELATRRKIHPKFLYYIQFAGIIFIGILLILAITADLRYFIP